MKTIPIAEVPQSGQGRGPAYPYAEWEAMPTDRAAEVELNGIKAKYACGNIRLYIERHRLGLLVMIRQGHVYVVRASEDKDEGS